MRLFVSILCASLLGPSLVACNKERAEGIKLLNDGIKREELGDHEIAYALYVRSSGIDPTNYRALFQMALIEMFDRNQPDKGIEHLLALQVLVLHEIKLGYGEFRPLLAGA